MERTVKKCYFDIHNWIASNNTILQLLLYPFIHCRNVFLWNHTTNNRINKLITLPRLLWLKFKPDMSVLASASRLPDKFALLLYSLLYSFSVRHLWFAHIGLNTKFTLHTVNNDFKVQL